MVSNCAKETQKAWRHNRANIISAKHTHQPMRLRVLSWIPVFYNIIYAPHLIQSQLSALGNSDCGKIMKILVITENVSNV